MKPLSRRVYALASISLIVVLFVTVNIVSNIWLRSARLDLTEGGLYSVSAGTRAILSKLEDPITLRFYYSREPASGYASIVAYSDRVRDLLQEYVALSGGKLILEEIDPAPFTPAEDDAVAQGLSGAPTQEGENVYFGLVGTNTLNGNERIAFFDQNREQYLEYDLTSMIYRLSLPEKPKLAVISALPLAAGSGGLAAALQGTSRPFAIYQQLRDTYDLQTIDTSADRIPADISTLLVIHPAAFSDATQYAIDQFVMRGGHAIIFVDPYSEIAGQQTPPGSLDVGDKSSSDLKPLFAAWGVDYDPTKVVTDAQLAQQVQVGGAGGVPQVVDYVAWMRMTPDTFNLNDPVTGNLQLLNIASAGALKAHQGATTKFTPLISSSSNAMLMDAMQIRFTQRPQDLIRRFQATGERFTVAARVTGPAKTAFPNGPPKETKETTPAADSKDKTPLPDEIKESPDINVILVADSDLIDDRFWVQIQNLLGQQIAIPTSDNGALVQNLVENMMGSNDLISLRTRERNSRPFTVVEQIRRDAESRFLAQEQALQEKVTQTEASLRALQGQGGDPAANPQGQGAPVLSQAQQQQIDRFRRDLVETRASLRQVQANLRRDVENLGNLLAFLNIALVPLILSAAAIGIAFVRSRRRAHAKGM